ncbi:glycosyltransferase family 2 protein [Pararobbsia alpina]|uniref:Putative glycosyltransferase YkoT n=1 Tax=Pararobbsia alpina TaxID=621374 RepID=A0A6S7AY49_9BURK|nr:glycosyltransferase family 2 protein [Pararobbsia alpina]CAB3780883.1 putative glycosyltransferase YkoT [Pararobbsia alpina]
MTKQIAIVVPCYNEEAVLKETMRRLNHELTSLKDAGKITRDSRVYFVDDGSHDKTWGIINEFVQTGAPAIGIKLSRNRGHQNALLAGLWIAKGDAVITIDADLQDDVAAIGKMIDEFDCGSDVVYGIRDSRETDTVFKRLTAHTFYKLLTTCGIETVYDHADYRLLSRRAVEALKEFREVNLYLRGIVPLIGFKSSSVKYDRAKRFAGETKYPLRKMVTLALEAITSLSVAPLRLISAFGFLLSAASFAITFWAIGVRLFTNEAIPGWASTVLPIYFLGGLQLLSLGVIGEYVGKIYLESKSRPRFIVEAVSELRESSRLK